MSAVDCLVLGRSGQVAQALALRAEGAELALQFAGRDVCDIAVPGAAATLIKQTRPSVVINAAAYTAVDKAETEEALALRLNGDAVGEAAAAAEAVGARFLHLSTDYVFDGAKASPFVETDPVNPQSAYGRSKLRGEQLALQAHPEALVLRTAWVYAPFGQNFVRTMLRLAQSREVVRVVADQQGNPTAALDIADALLALAKTRGRGGVFHMTASGEAVWADLAEATFAGAADRGGPSARVERITTAEYPTPARRPANSRLDCMALESAHGVRLRDWREGLADCLDRLRADEWRV